MATEEGWNLASSKRGAISASHITLEGLLWVPRALLYVTSTQKEEGVKKSKKSC